MSGVEPSDDDVDQNSDVNGRNVRKKSNQKIECVQKVLCFDYWMFFYNLLSLRKK